MIKVLYPGSFDPITKGHMNIVEQALDLFDEVVIAVMENSAKKTSFFTTEERVQMIKELYANNPKVTVVSGKDASVDIAIKNNCQAMVRGLRSLTDFEYEIQIAQVNREISDNKINTICLFTNPRLQTISSSIVKEVFGLNKDISKYVDPIIAQKMLEKKTTNI